MPVTEVNGVYDADVAPAIDVPPLFEAEAFLYHWYPLIDPLPALAVIDKAVAAPFRQIFCTEVEGCVVNTGMAFTVSVPVAPEPPLPLNVGEVDPRAIL